MKTKIAFYHELIRCARFYGQEYFFSDEYGLSLFEPSSQTQKYKQYYGEMVVDLITSEWQGEVFVRESLLFAQNQPLMFAKAIVPAATMQAKTGLECLGERPLGEWLFGEHKATRSVQIARSGEYYLRKSLFDVGGYPLFLYEVFLTREVASVE